MPPQQGAGMDRAHSGRDQFASVPRCHDDIAILDLPLARLLADLTNGFGHAGEVAEVIAGEQTPAGVDRDAAARPHGARFDERAPFTLLEETVILELKQNLSGEAVVELCAIDIVECEGRLSEGLLLGRLHGHMSEV